MILCTKNHDALVGDGTAAEQLGDDDEHGDEYQHHGGNGRQGGVHLKQ